MNGHNAAVRILKILLPSALWPREDGHLRIKTWAPTKQWLHQHLDLGLSKLQNSRNNNLYLLFKATYAWCSVTAAWTEEDKEETFTSLAPSSDSQQTLPPANGWSVSGSRGCLLQGLASPLDQWLPEVCVLMMNSRSSAEWVQTPDAF